MKKYLISPACAECGEQMLRSVEVDDISGLIDGMLATDCSLKTPNIEEIQLAEIYICNNHESKCTIKLTTNNQRFWYSV